MTQQKCVICLLVGGLCTDLMAIPDLDSYGLLPVGQFSCTLAEVEQNFCWNPHRVGLYDGLTRFLVDQWYPLNIQAEFWMDGSFTRKKESPEDIDLVADVSHLSIQDLAPVIILQMQNDLHKTQYHIDFWFKHPAVLNDLTAFFQYTGLKAGAELNLDPKRKKGILKVTV